MIISSDFQDFSNGMVYSQAHFTREFMVRFGDDYFYNFVGTQGGIKLTELLHEDSRDEFVNAALSIKGDESVRLVCLLKGHDEKYHLCDVTISDSGRHDGDEELLDLEIYSLISMEHRYFESVNASNKYKTFLSMYHDYLFDYDYETNIFSLFYYDSVRASLVVKGPLEDVREKVVSHFDEEKGIEAVNAFFDSIHGPNEGANYEFDGPDIADYNHKVRYNISTRIMYKHNRTKLLIGIVKCDNNDSSTAFYNKPEARDVFTGLYNKKACQLLVKDTISNDQNIHYMIVMDVDNFKNINDRYGHLCGDQVILKVAEIINKGVSGRGVVGRFGGDEFFVFTRSIDDESTLRAMMTYIRKSLKQEFQDQFGGDGLTMSLGISTYPIDGNTYDELFNKADKSLYIAKDKGKNRFVIYDPAKHGELTEDDGKIATGIDDVHGNTEEIAEGVAKVILRLTGTSCGLGQAIIDLAPILGVDGIRVYVKSLGEMLTHTGEYGNLRTLEPLIFTERYDALFVNKDYSSTGIITNIEMADNEIYKANVEAGIGGYFACRHKTRFGDEVRVFYDNIGRKCNLSQADRQAMLMMTAVIAGFLEL